MAIQKWVRFVINPNSIQFLARYTDLRDSDGYEHWPHLLEEPTRVITGVILNPMTFQCSGSWRQCAAPYLSDPLAFEGAASWPKNL
jgi:hypothetical protein